jgi:hypothetical protein
MTRPESPNVTGSRGPVIGPEPWLRADGAAHHLGVGLGTVERLKHLGLPSHRMSESRTGVCLFLATELDQWRSNHACLPSKPPPHLRRPRYRPRPDALTSAFRAPLGLRPAGHAGSDAP